MRHIITMFWAIIFCLIIGFIASALTQMDFNPTQSVIVGAIFGFLFDILPTLMQKSVAKQNSES